MAMAIMMTTHFATVGHECKWEVLSFSQLTDEWRQEPDAKPDESSHPRIICIERLGAPPKSISRPRQSLWYTLIVPVIGHVDLRVIPDRLEDIDLRRPVLPVPTALKAGTSAIASVKIVNTYAWSPANGDVTGWIDFNRNGTFDYPAERIGTQSLVVTTGTTNCTLTFAVPASAKPNWPWTFARFRYSSQGGLSYSGSAGDGEVEDYRITIEPMATHGAAVEPNYVKWSQPAIEVDPQIGLAPVFCGWDEPSSSTRVAGQARNWRINLDDFHCLGPFQSPASAGGART